MTRLPEDVAAIIRRPQRLGEPAQAFPFLTVDDAGLPHVALLSQRELAAAADGTLHAALAAPTTTRANLERSQAATIVAVEGTTVHSVKLRLRTLFEEDGLVGIVLDVLAHKADSLGIEVAPMSFVPTEELGRMERWDRADRMLQRLAAEGEGHDDNSS